ncbi:MAG TPA: group 1 glycosyl transferase [Cyanothece sp. UBA12306]|nr:group 1 glycosyl transferase [Cyanothece sp. UBA12306]
MNYINIISIDNQHGLTRCSLILAEVLRKAGFRVSFFKVGHSSLEHKIHRISTYLEKFASNFFRKRPPYDINIFIQDIIPAWFPYARVNCLLPMPEWFAENSLSLLPQIDYVLCCTKLTQEIFDKLGCKTEFTSFSSVDQFNPKYTKDYDKIFHLAGSNASQKGTKTLIEVWSKHPEWPVLTIRQQAKSFHVRAKNIEYITQFLEPEILIEYQNNSGVHLCPSEVEGFGHYIVEAMTTKAVVITTDAPPMNELISPERGKLAQYRGTEKLRLGTKYYVDPESLEQKIEEVLGMDYQTKQQLGENARKWYLENDQFFRQKIVEILRHL